MNDLFKRHTISTEATLATALDRLNALSGSVMTLLVLDNEGRMQGTLTDGDVRRALLRGVTMTMPVTEAMHKSFKHLDEGKIDVARLRRYRNEGISLIPVLHPDGSVARIIDTRVNSTILPLSAIVMAGGKGERLRPMTLNCPKPLLEIGGKAIIDYNIDALKRVGIHDITVTVNYLAGMMLDHFSGSGIRCIVEERPLGTIGAASLVEHQEPGDTLVMNSDLLTTISFEDMYLTHVTERADITIAAVPYNISIPYAILDTDGKLVKSLEEKPSYSYYANAGIYIFSNKVLNTLPEGTPVDAPDLIESAIKAGRKVVYYPIDGTWIDIGTPADFLHAKELIELKNR